jgi:transcriptional regulator with XRE-family HTH domain
MIQDIGVERSRRPSRETSLEDQVLHQTDTAPRDATPQDSVEQISPSVGHPGATTFPTLLQNLRNARGWSKADLAKRAAFDPSTITRLEQGSRAPERETVTQLADAMALPMTDRDRLLAASGYRSDTWDDPDLIEIATLLADPSLPPAVRREIRTILRVAASHGKLHRMYPHQTPADT